MTNVGIIGCGGMGTHHSRSLAHFDDVSLAAASDVSSEALARYDEEFHPSRTYGEYQDLLADDGVDAVLICVPTFLHPQVVKAAAQAGKQVFCEKPIALSVADAEGMIEACDRAGVIFMMGFVRRFDHDWGTFKRLVETGAIGRPVVWRHFMASGGPRSPWYLDRAKGGGPIIDGAIHDIDFANWLFGDMAWSTGAVRHFKSSSFDTATVSIGYESGDELLLSWTWGLPTGASGLHGQDAIAAGGTILFPHNFPREELPAEADSPDLGAYLLDTGSERRVETFQKNDMFLDEMRHFVDCCQSGATPAVTGEDGLKAIRVALAALDGAREV